MTPRRLFLGGLLVALLVSYVGPVQGYLVERAELREKQTALTALQREREGLRVEVRALQDPVVVEARARQMGYIKPGETAYRVPDLEPPPPPTPGRRDDGGFWSWLPNLF